MGRNINSTKLTKQTILSKISQITIFATYLNLQDSIIQECIDKGTLICSPLRDDVHPTCGFRYDNKGKLKFRDFSGFFWGDCFDVVAYVMSDIYHKSFDIANKEDFIKVLRHITFTFRDIFYGQEKDINLINAINVSISNIKNKKNIIELVVRPWNKQDIEYWKQFNIDVSWLNVNFIHPIDQYYINRKINPTPKYYYDSTDPCYGYLLGRDRNGIYNIKLYFPYRKHGTNRFITNCNHLEGIYNLERNDYDVIVITKSTKDRLSLSRTVNQWLFPYGGVPKDNNDNAGRNGINNIGYINIPHETYKLRQNEYDWLRSKLNSNGKIISLMDNDRTGMREAIWLKRTFNITPILIPKFTKCKDFAELVSKLNIQGVKMLLQQTYLYLTYD